MSVGISYMGTKRNLAPAVCDVIGHAQKGIMLDAFAGMCSVGERVGPLRQVWSNDVQVFAAEVGRALFTSRDEPLDSVLVADLHFEAFQEHQYLLSEIYRRSLTAENALLESPSFAVFEKRKTRLSRIHEVEVSSPTQQCRDLFITTYSDSYFGIRQSIEADAIISAVHSAHTAGATTEDHRRWLIIALGRALLKISNSTGHFAQYLKPRQSSYRRFLSQRKRSLWTEWLTSIGEIRSVGTAEWRARNIGFNQDSLVLLPSLCELDNHVAVIYADPPYTDDQYSRFYHVFETLVLYDYPPTSGAGLYRPGRFSSPFSVKSRAVRAFDRLVGGSALTGADLVLSYPTNGLVHECGADPKRMLKKYYRKVECCYSLPHSHSTFGASKGAAQSRVTERIYLAKS